jgi:hypothetical protein
VPDPTDDPASAPARLELGTRVEVRTGFDRSWSNGFEIAEVADIGYRVRRRSDGHVLPVPFPPVDVRRERKSSMWWY